MGLSLKADLYTCNFENTEFCGLDHGFNITEALWSLKNQKLRKFFNFRNTQSLN